VLFPIPGWVLRIVLGEFSGAILTGQRASSARAQSNGYVYAFPELRAALSDLIQ
jgi:NAD dependent epimerase/dehydratase family enzyme